MTYRTMEQFEEIVDSAINGNWTQAAEECIEYGFYANDLINRYKEMIENVGELAYFEPTDLALLAEEAERIRCRED